jgi:hypothetical protein
MYVLWLTETSHCLEGNSTRPNSNGVYVRRTKMEYKESRWRYEAIHNTLTVPLMILTSLTPASSYAPSIDL